MQKMSLDALAREKVEAARRSSAGRAAATVYGGHERALRQTVVALRAGAGLDEHDSPGEATLLVLTGRVTLSSGADSWQGRTGDLIIIPDARHSVHADEDSAFLLTAVPRAHIAS
jgi:quercetin dioxygenase-like cupin family protein